MQLASEFKEESVARRGRLWTFEEEAEGSRPGLTGEVSEAMRLDIPSPRGARILLANVQSAPLASPFSLSSVSSPGLLAWRAAVQEAGRPTEEN